MDPGITTGVAILDSYGNILNIYSKRNISRGEVIRQILKFGNPVIMSCDVGVVPKSVEKTATKLGCIIFSPEISLSAIEKRELIRDYYSSLKNDHEVDALSAAIKAWKHYRSLFRKIEDVLDKFGRKEIFWDILLKIVKEKSPNIEDAVREFIEKEKPLVAESMPEKTSAQKNLTERLEKRLVEKQREIDSLHNQNILLSKALNEAKRKVSELEMVRVTIGEADYHTRLDAVDYMKKLRRIENKGYYPVIEIEKMDVDLVEQLHEDIDLEGRIVLSKNGDPSLLNGKNIKCLLAFRDIETENLDFPVIQIGEDLLENFDGIKTIKTDYIERRLVDAKKAGLVGWLRRYRKRKD